jgi:hypothetical protein
MNWIVGVSILFGAIALGYTVLVCLRGIVGFVREARRIR